MKTILREFRGSSLEFLLNDYNIVIRVNSEIVDSIAISQKFDLIEDDFINTKPDTSNEYDDFVVKVEEYMEDLLNSKIIIPEIDEVYLETKSPFAVIGLTKFIKETFLEYWNEHYKKVNPNDLNINSIIATLLSEFSEKDLFNLKEKYDNVLKLENTDELEYNPIYDRLTFLIDSQLHGCEKYIDVSNDGHYFEKVDDILKDNIQMILTLLDPNIKHSIAKAIKEKTDKKSMPNEGCCHAAAPRCEKSNDNGIDSFFL